MYVALILTNLDTIGCLESIVSLSAGCVDI